jgi:succinylglutamate desuccinylase
MKVYVIAALHGTETFGLKVIAHLQRIHNEYITTAIGHPEAIAKKKRFLDTDLNRSFAALSEDSRETYIAARIKATIEAEQPDLIIDLHTSVEEVGRVAILALPNQRLMSYATLLGMERIAVMPPSIAQASLIGQFPDKAISIEYGPHLRSDALAQKLAEAIVRLVHVKKIRASSTIPIYFVERIIHNQEAEGLTLQNYVYNETLKGYPFLAGKNSYGSYQGFLATKQQKH